jgi:hypothetical protein
MKNSLNIIYALLLFINISCKAEDVEIEIVSQENTIRTMTVSSNTSELNFYRESISGINGLEQLKHLKKMTFMMISNPLQLDFLRSNNTIEFLAFDSCNIVSFDYINTISELKYLSFESCNIDTEDIDLKESTKLVFLGFNNLHLYKNEKRIQKIPQGLKIPHSLKYLNLSFNDIDELNISELNSLKTVNFILLDNNKIKSYMVSDLITQFGNLYFNRGEIELPEEYKNSNIW